MFPAPLSERLDALIDDLILDGGLESASLASILLAAKDSVKSDYHVSLSRRVWAANDDLRQAVFQTTDSIIRLTPVDAESPAVEVSP